MLLTMEPSRVMFYILVNGGYTGSYIFTIQRTIQLHMCYVLFYKLYLKKK